MVGALLLTPGSARAQQRVAVLEFTGDPDVASDAELAYLADKTRGAALKTLDPAEWQVMTRENMLVMLESNTEDLAACLGECEVETGRSIGAQQVVAGSLLKLGATLRLTLKSFDTESGQLLGYEEVSASDLEELADGISTACTGLFGGPRPGSGTAATAVEAAGGEERTGDHDAAAPPSGRATAVSSPGTVIDELSYKMVRVESRRSLIGATEVTQELWETVMGTNPSSFVGAQRPVEGVSWDDAVAFCNGLSDLEGLNRAYHFDGTEVAWDRVADGYRLPTEEEWEHAARAEKNHKYSGSNNIGKVGWHSGNSGGMTHPVAEKHPNAWGLYDMSGNVWEWVWDLHESEEPFRGIRGGSWELEPRFALFADRAGAAPGNRASSLGFRLARTLP